MTKTPQVLRLVLWTARQARKIAKHIFVADKGEFYGIADGVPQKD